MAGFVVSGGIVSVDPLFHIDHGLSVTSMGALFIYLGIVTLFFVPNLFLGRRAMCHCICWMAPFMVIGEKVGMAFRVPQLKVTTKPDGCVSCGGCDRVCPMSLPVSELLEPGCIDHPECIQCGACCDACGKDVLELRFGR